MSNQQNCKIIVYWLEKSRAQRIVWLLEELNLEYELKIYKRGSDKLAPKELKDIHPLGKSPLISIQPEGAEKPIVLAESGVIIEYLAEHFGKRLIPDRYPEGKDGGVGAETDAWLRYRYLLHYSEGSFMPVLIICIVVDGIRNAPVPFFLKPITGGIANKVYSVFINPELKNHLSFLENYLATAPGGGSYFCGPSITAADIQLSFVLEGAVSHGCLTESAYPKLYSYVRRFQDTESYKRAGQRIESATGEKFVPFSEVKF
ncbi:glutathione transferase [Aaosphaeria arxii CBS 175.79]|uniref:glutathione transferase n=1 Tax=Aaosphaeria arxii CBS 175.79 TaxID=1450172 RepID=A0A6A5XF63_9PLEO|nr:glutathione transferase [Aaosphaeria arxii CBS 175.79]KAF2011024.1 glutathione transferase [Aaosphaeria arxii CBS 175.79]